MHDDHLSEEELGQFANGQLEAAGMELYLAHVDACEYCQERLEAHWHLNFELPPQIAASSQLEKVIMQRVARHEAMSQSTNLLVTGYLQTVFSLFTALLGLIAPKK